MHPLSPSPPCSRVACVTGGARRIGKAIVEALHQAGFNIVIHYQASHTEAQSLADTLNHIRPQSATLVQGNLQAIDALTELAKTIIAQFGRLDLLVHNASRFYPTPLGQITQTDWQNLMDSNAQAPLFLTQALLPQLQTSQGCIISILDIHANARPFVGYSLYNMAKSAHQMLVQSLALELAPQVRVNGVAPGVNILPESDTEQALNADDIERICQRIPMGRIGTPQDIAQAVVFLATAPYITGQVLAVDGGRSLTLAGG
ncbi:MULTISPECIES: pteridine reductase [unclassified Moraxella]|uniref:pteridine reductase n=1 Tax=unclassified Moraxella TaxID=2685852 RepID=UPI003AF883F3